MESEKEAFERLNMQYGINEPQPQKPMGFFRKIFMVLFKPGKFFENVKSEKGIKRAFIYFSILSLFFIIMGFPLVFASYLQVVQTPSLGFSIVLASFVTVSYFMFFYSGTFHIISKVLGGRGSYSESYKAAAYATTPIILFAGIPLSFISIFTLVYSFGLLVIGFSKMHDISKKKSLIITIISLSLVAAVSYLVFILIGSDNIFRMSINFLGSLSEMSPF